MGGTSAVSPFWSAFLARVQTLSKNAVPKNDILEIMYAHRSVYNDVIVGNNGYYHAQQGWDPTTGNDSPNGVLLLKLFEDCFPPSKKKDEFPVWAIALIVVLVVVIIVSAGVTASVIHIRSAKKLI